MDYIVGYRVVAVCPTNREHKVVSSRLIANAEVRESHHKRKQKDKNEKLVFFNKCIEMHRKVMFAYVTVGTQTIQRSMNYVARLRKLSQIRIMRVLFIGGIGFVIQTTIFEILAVWLRLMPASTAAVIGAEVAILCNFTLNQKFSFSQTHENTLPLWQRILRFHMVVSGSIFLQWLFIFVTERFTENLTYIHLAYALGVVVGFISNYLGYKFFVWKKKDALSHAANV